MTLWKCTNSSRQPINRAALAEYATNVTLKMVCDDGFFHADPHPGNFFIEPDGRIGLIDFGMVGRVDERTQELLADLLLEIGKEDAERLVDVFLDLGVARERVNRELLRRDIEHLLRTFWGRPLKEIKIGSLFNEVFTVMRSICLSPARVGAMGVGSFCFWIHMCPRAGCLFGLEYFANKA